MSSRKNYPKEREQKLKDTIKTLRADLRQAKKEIRILKSELKNIVKPVRKRKTHTEKAKLTHEEWRESFLKRVNETLKKKDK